MSPSWCFKNTFKFFGENIITDQDGTLIVDIFIKYKILNILFCVEIVKNLFSPYYCNHINVIFLEEVK